MWAKDNIFFISIVFIAVLIISFFRLFFEIGFLNKLISFLCLIIIFIVILYYLSKKYIKKNKKIIFLILIIALFVKIVLMISMHQIMVFPDEITAYDQLSWRQTATWYGDDTTQIGPKRCIGRAISNNTCVGGATHYYYLVAIIYYVFEHSIMIAKLFNIFFSVLGGFLIYLITKEIFKKESISKIALILVLFFPSVTFYTLPLLREAFNLFLMTLSFFCAIKLIKTFKIRYVLFLLMCFNILWNTRNYITVVLIFVIGIGILINMIAKLKVSKFIIIFCLLVFLFAMQPDLFDYYNPISHFDLNFKHLDWQRLHTAKENSAFLVGEDISTLKNAAVFLPKGLAYFFFSPFPWEMSGIKELITIPISLLWYCLLPFIIWGLAMTYKNKKILDCFPLLIFCLLTILLYSFIDGNIWLLDRHKIQATYFLLIFGAVGINQFLKIFYKYYKK